MKRSPFELVSVDVELVGTCRKQTHDAWWLRVANCVTDLKFFYYSIFLLSLSLLCSFISVLIRLAEEGKANRQMGVYGVLLYVELSCRFSDTLSTGLRNVPTTSRIIEIYPILDQCFILGYVISQVLVYGK
jgi:hypothetical protein